MLTKQVRIGGLTLDWVTLLKALTAALLLAILGFIALQPLRVNIDSAVYLQVGNYIVEGRQPYIDFKEINPPLVYLLHVIPSLIASLLNVNVIPVFQLMLWLMAALSAYACYRLLRHYPDQGVMLSTWLPLMAVAHTIYLYFIVDYGQRDHYFVLLYLPYFLLRELRWRHPEKAIPASLAVFVGLTGGIGLSIKPYFLLFPMLAELHWLIRTREVRRLFAPENFAVAAVGLNYAFIFLLLPTDIRQAYFHEILPVASKLYGRLDIGAIWYSLQWPFVWPILALMIIPWLLKERSPLPRSLSLAALAGFIAYVVQAKGLYYQYMEATLFSLLAVTAFVVTQFPARRVAQGVLGVFVGAVLLTGFMQRAHMRGLPDQLLRELVYEYTDEGEGIVMIGAFVTGPRLALQTDRPLSTTYVMGYPLWFSYLDVGSDDEAVYADPYPLPPEVADYLESMKQIIETEQPSLIFVSSEYVGWIKASRLLEAVNFTQQYIDPYYTFLDRVNDYDVYVRD